MKYFAFIALLAGVACSTGPEIKGSEQKLPKASKELYPRDRLFKKDTLSASRFSENSVQRSIDDQGEIEGSKFDAHGNLIIYKGASESSYSERIIRVEARNCPYRNSGRPCPDENKQYRGEFFKYESQ